MKGRIDWVLVGAILVLVAIGTVAILSAAAPLPVYSRILEKHFIAFCIGAILFMFGLGLNYQIFQDQAKIVYAAGLTLLITVLVAGTVHKGQKAWLKLPFFSFQPSELARLCTILALANFLENRLTRVQRLSTVAGSLALVAPMVLLILAEPDFSSTITFFPMVLAMMFCAGANTLHLAALIAYGAIVAGFPLLWTLLSLRPKWIETSSVAAFLLRINDFNLSFLITIAGIFVLAYLVWRALNSARIFFPGPFFAIGALIVSLGLLSAVAVNKHLKVYQRNRFVAFLLPEADMRGASYNVQQAQIAIGSGGLWGKGVFSGTQSQLGFIPERHTDFIYAVIGEEMGFIGSISVIGIYLLLISRIVHAARMSRDRYGQLVCIGIAAVYGTYMLLNIGMCLGLAPVVGVPLPLVSYGGSNLAITLFSMGIIANVYSRRYAFY